ncbi:MAG: hypothetical protein HOV79_10185 [Hamadaea sp.]|nr:hypothetical protein [Hamadaea sp.]
MADRTRCAWTFGWPGALPVVAAYVAVTTSMWWRSLRPRRSAAAEH